MDFRQVVDIDSNYEDPQCCSLYAADIYDNIHVAEVFNYNDPKCLHLFTINFIRTFGVI